MSRFFKSAAFPILIVVVLAFFAQKLISPGTFLYLAVDKKQSNLAIVRTAVNKHAGALV